MKKLPKGIQNIRQILQKDYLYIDKTLFAKDLIDCEKYVFMSRPRRFGKSLFLNTLKAIFQGEKELFKPCKIYSSDYEWEKYPVLYFDFYRINTGLEETFHELIVRDLQTRISDLGIDISGNQSPTIGELLSVLVKHLSKENPVVILVDEYDHPIVNCLDEEGAIEENRKTLRSFFGTIKSLDEHIHFSFVTGVTKFSQTTLFSGPNQYSDITFLPQYAEVMGYTHKEILNSFSPYIEKIAKIRGISASEVVEEVRAWYNGYRFSEKEASVYNPYSTILYFSSLRHPKGYWYSSGTPHFLFKEISKHNSLTKLTGVIRKSESSLSDIARTDRIDLISLMYQAGYLTITKYSREYDSNIFDLDFPNKEVRSAFSKSLLADVAHVEDDEIGSLPHSLKTSIESDDLPTFFDKVKSAFGRIPYQISQEKQFESTYHSIFLALLIGSNIFVEAEVSVSSGRIDLKIHAQKVIYIIELKLNKSTDAALTQIKEKQYADPFIGQGKKIVLVGVNFSTTTKNIEGWESEELSNH